MLVFDDKMQNLSWRFRHQTEEEVQAPRLANLSAALFSSPKMRVKRAFIYSIESKQFFQRLGKVQGEEDVTITEMKNHKHNHIQSRDLAIPAHNQARCRCLISSQIIFA